MSASVVLTEYEMGMCADVGRARFANAEVNRRNHGLGPSKFDRTPNRDIVGAQCEFAASLIVDRSWRPNVGYIDRPDVGKCIEVRSTVLTYGRLIVKPDAKEWPYVLIYQDGPRHQFLGWAMASRVMREPLCTEHGDPAHFMAQSKLDPLRTLITYLGRYDHE